MWPRFFDASLTLNFFNMHLFKNTFFLLASTLALASAPVLAHVVLQDGAAAANSSYRATFRVGHGCDGDATTNGSE